MRSPGKSRGPSGAVPGAGMPRPPRAAEDAPHGGSRGGGDVTPRTFPFAPSRLKIQIHPPTHTDPPPFPRAARYIFLREPRTGSAPRRARGAGGPRLPAPPPARPASAGRRNSSAFLPCASSLFLPLPGAAASFPTSTLPKLFSRSPERGGLPQLPAAGSRLLLNFWGSRMSKMEKEIL